MGLTNGILTAPFTKIALNGQGDLQKALGRTTCMSEIQLVGDVDVNSADVDAINKWSKHKPFAPLTATAVYAFDASKATPELRSPERCAAALAVDYGLLIPTYTSAADFHANWMTGWTYQKPASNYRALDMDGYATDEYMSSALGFNRGDPKQTAQNFMRFPMGGALMVPDPANISNGSNSFPIWINQHESDNCVLAPSDFAGATGNNSVVNGTRVDISKMYFGLAAIYRGGGTNPHQYDKVWVGSTALTSTGQVGYYPSDLSVGVLGDYYLVPVLAEAADKDVWIGLNAVNRIASIDGYGMAVTFKALIREMVIKAGYSQSASTSSAAQFNFYFQNNLAAGALIQELRCYVIAEGTYQDSDYTATFNQLKSDLAAGQDPMANVLVSGKIVARYFNIINDLSSTTILTTATQSFRHNIGAVEDGLGNPYNVLSCVLLFIKYKSPTNATTSTIETRELYYRNGNIITD